MSAPKSRSLPLATGISCHLLEWGDASKETLLLIHGFLDNAWSWESTVNAGLAERFHVLAPDMRGHGDSDRIGSGGYYHFMDYVADLASIVESTRQPQVSLVGHSMGGSIVAYFAGAFPERCRRVALLEGMGPPEQNDSAPERVARWVEASKRARVRNNTGYASLDAAAERLLGTDQLLKKDVARRLAGKGARLESDGKWRFKHDPLHLTTGPYPFRRSVAESFWKRISCPVLLVEGADSPYRALEETELRSQYLRHARKSLLSDAGHMLQRHQPEALARLLIQHLDAPTP